MMSAELFMAHGLPAILRLIPAVNPRHFYFRLASFLCSALITLDVGPAFCRPLLIKVRSFNLQATECRPYFKHHYRKM